MTLYLSILYRQEQDKMTFQKHHAELKEKKLATLQEKLEIKRRGKTILSRHK